MTLNALNQESPREKLEPIHKKETRHIGPQSYFLSPLELKALCQKMVDKCDNLPIEWQEAILREERVLNSEGQDITEVVTFYSQLKHLLNEATEKLKGAKTIVILGNVDGIGDFVLYSRFALALALGLPDKNIVFLAREPSLLLGQEKLPPNLILSAKKLDEFLDSDCDNHSEPCWFINLTAHHVHYLFKALTKNKKSYSIFPSNDPQFNCMRDLRYKINGDEKEWFHNTTYHQLLLRLFFGLTVTNLEAPLALVENSKKIFDLLIVYDASDGDRIKILPSSTWAKVIAAVAENPNVKIGIVLGLNHPQDVILIKTKLQAFNFPVSNVNLGEILDNPRLITDSQERVFIVETTDHFDAQRKNKLKKLRFMSWWRALRGKAKVSQPSTSLYKLLTLITRSRVYAGVDTGFTHLANEQLRRPRTPKVLRNVIGVFGSEKFVAEYWLPDQGHTIVFPDLNTASWQSIANLINEKLL